MKINGKKIIGMMLVFLLTLPIMGAGMSKGEVKLDLDDYHQKVTNTAVSFSGKQKSIADGKIVYKIPDSMAEIDGAEIFNPHIYQENDGELYLNGDAVFGIFYFDSDFFVEEKDEKDEIRAIERAIISDICPSEKKNLSWTSLSLKHYNFPTCQSISASGVIYDHYVGKYENFRVEFAFTEAPSGLCVVMFIYNHDNTSAEDALKVLESITIG